MKTSDFLKLLACILAFSTIIVAISCRPSKQARVVSPAKPTSIMWAAMAGDLDSLKTLEAQGQSLNFQDPHARYWTPLIAAIYHGQTNVIDYLVTRGVNLDLYGIDGDTALMEAMIFDDTNTVKLLLENGADVTVTNKWGFSAFTSAEASPHRTILLEWLNQHKPKGK